MTGNETRPSVVLECMCFFTLEPYFTDTPRDLRYWDTLFDQHAMFAFWVEEPGNETGAYNAHIHVNMAYIFILVCNLKACLAVQNLHAIIERVYVCYLCVGGERDRCLGSTGGDRCGWNPDGYQKCNPSLQQYWCFTYCTNKQHW